MRLRSRGVNSFRSQTSPNKTSSVSDTSFGAKSPNVFFILLSLFESGICSSFDSLLRGHQLQCCRTRLRGYHRVNIRCAVSLVLRLIGSVYLVVERLIGACVHKRHILLYPPATMRPSGRRCVCRNQAVSRPRYARTYSSSPMRTTQITTGFRSVPSFLKDASCSSSAAPILSRSLCVQPVIA